MVAIPIILALFHQILLNFVVKQDTPAYIYTTTKQNKENATLEVLRKLYPEERAQKELLTLIKIIGNCEKQQEKVTLTILLKNYKIRLLNGFCMVGSFHFGLTYPILMFSNKILEKHQSKSTATLITTLTPIMDFLALLPAMFLVKRYGIKRLYCISASCVIFSALLFAILGYAEQYTFQKFIIWLIRLSCSFGIPAALFSYSAEILPFIGNTINTSFMYTLGFLIMQFYLPVSNALGGHEGAFILFASGLFIILIIAWPCGLMVNTQGLTKEEINERFDNFRWFYRTKIKKQSEDHVIEK